MSLLAFNKQLTFLRLDYQYLHFRAPCKYEEFENDISYFDIQSYQKEPSRPKKCPSGTIYKVRNNDFGFYWVENRGLQLERRVYFISILFSK